MPKDKKFEDSKPVPETKEEAKSDFAPKKIEVSWSYVGPTGNKLVLIATDPNDLSTYRLSEDGKTPKGLPTNWSILLSEFVDNPDEITLRLWRFGIYNPVHVDTQTHQYIRALASRFLVSHAKHNDINKFEQQLLAVIKKD